MVKQFVLSTSENINGEGVFSKVKHSSGEEIEVVCGNAKILRRYDVNWGSDEFKEQAQ